MASSPGATRRRQCYRNSLKIIDDMGQFVRSTKPKTGDRICSAASQHDQLPNAEELAVSILPYLRGKVATTRRSIGHYDASDDVMQFVNSKHARELAALGTSCPDHFIRTTHRAAVCRVETRKSDIGELKQAIRAARTLSRDVYGVLQRQ